MSKQLLINERPSDNVGSYSGGGGGDDWPKASIGNYKGVMLCNRPNELGQQRKPDRGGNLPFNSRVTHDEPVGWNPTKKVLPKGKKRVDPNNALLKHKRFLKGLEEQKVKEKEDKEKEHQEKQEKVKKFKDNAGVQRKKIKELKRDDVLNKNEDAVAEDYQEELPRARLTEENLKKSEQAQADIQKKPQSKASQNKKGKQKPAWALTEKDVEEQKEKEIDDLLEFAYELDYEKFMDDFEVRQALAIIKDRVNEIKKDQDWKENIAKEWNEAAADEAGIAAEDYQQKGQRAAKTGNDDTKSQVSYQSAKTGMSKKSLRTQVMEAIKEEGRPDWDPSVKSENKVTTEDRIAAKLAQEVLKDNTKLRGVHSHNSIKKLLEKEAKKQLMSDYKGPIINVVKDKEMKDALDPSYLPYLHKNPAI